MDDSKDDRCENIKNHKKKNDGVKAKA